MRGKWKARNKWGTSYVAEHRIDVELVLIINRHLQLKGETHTKGLVSDYTWILVRIKCTEGTSQYHSPPKNEIHIAMRQNIINCACVCVGDLSSHIPKSHA